ncbi:MAG TPA: orotidine-5'-phosphate decarboxylase [Bacteroidetes bacterium]|nr:orotidine-5'-phosphate decarboxylase [Bacteroidota bacterium]
MTANQLFTLILKKKSFLCIGLDTDINKIPEHLKVVPDPVFEFNKTIVDATHDLAVAYKPNLAFYESLGASGWESLEKTVNYIRQKTKDIFLIADAKRSDIGNTSALYAKTFFGTFNFDAVTLAPYMGLDTVSPFLAYEDKWSVILALTSNKSAEDFQYVTDKNTGKRLYETVLEKSSRWGTTDQIMYVVGATKAEALKDIRKIVPDHFLLVPGVGAQGGSLQEVTKYGMNNRCGLLVNSSRGIIYASAEEDFAEQARTKALAMQEEMEELMKEKNLLEIY